MYQNFYYSIFIWSSACFGRHTAHHQEPKTALAASGFSYVEGWWTCSWWTLSGTYCAWQRPPTTLPTTFHVWKTRGCLCSFRLLMMGGASSETCWASYKYGTIKKVWYIIASYWIFPYEVYPKFLLWLFHVCKELCLNPGWQFYWFFQNIDRLLSETRNSLGPVKSETPP